MKGDVRVGISGWRYGPWRGVFYPPKLPHKDELSYASRRLRTIEINGSFYSLQRPSSYAAWRDETPPGFVFAVKGSRFLTHNKKLLDCEGPLANFFASGVLALEEKLGPILWQLPPQLAFRPERLAGFFDILPRTTREAARIGARHDHRIKHGAYLDVRQERRLRYAIEVRHDTFHDPAFVRLLREHDIALCIADTAGKWPFIEAITSDFVYVRLHGDKRIYVSGYGSHALDAWAEKIERMRRGGRDVYVYFDNDVKVRAPFDAMNLAARFGQNDFVTFPRKLLAARGAAEPRETWDRWRYGRRSA